MGIIQKGWKAFKQMLDQRRFSKALRREMPKAMRRAGEILEDEYKEAINKGKIGPRNKPLTIAIKKHEARLLDSGRMRDAIQTELVAWNTVIVGIPKGTPAYRVAKIVSEGARIEVTERMRSMFMVLWKVSEGQLPVSRLEGRAAELYSRFPGPWFPLSRRKKVIRIPPRPFIQRTFKKKSIRRKMEKQIQLGVVRAWKSHIRVAKGKG